MKTTLAGLEYDTEYCFVAFVKTGNGAIFYGEQQSFRTTSDPDGIKEIAESQQTTDNGQQITYGGTTAGERRTIVTNQIINVR